MKTGLNISFSVVILTVGIFSTFSGAKFADDNLTIRDLNDLKSDDKTPIDLWTEATDVMDYFAVNNDVMDLNLKCWSGYWSRGNKTIEEVQCSGPCVTHVFWFGTIFTCGAGNLPDGCRHVMGSITCACRRPLCNNGTIPDIPPRFVLSNVIPGA